MPRASVSIFQRWRLPHPLETFLMLLFSARKEEEPWKEEEQGGVVITGCSITSGNRFGGCCSNLFIVIDRSAKLAITMVLTIKNCFFIMK